jgi:hypothetical protein
VAWTVCCHTVSWRRAMPCATCRYIGRSESAPWRQQKFLSAVAHVQLRSARRRDSAVARGAFVVVVVLPLLLRWWCWWWRAWRRVCVWVVVSHLALLRRWRARRRCRLGRRNVCAQQIGRKNIEYAWNSNHNDQDCLCSCFVKTVSRVPRNSTLSTQLAGSTQTNRLMSSFGVYFVVADKMPHRSRMLLMSGSTMMRRRSTSSRSSVRSNMLQYATGGSSGVLTLRACSYSEAIQFLSGYKTEFDVQFVPGEHE